MTGLLVKKCCCEPAIPCDASSCNLSYWMTATVPVPPITFEYSFQGDEWVANIASLVLTGSGLLARGEGYPYLAVFDPIAYTVLNTTVFNTALVSCNPIPPDQTLTNFIVTTFRFKYRSVRISDGFAIDIQGRIISRATYPLTTAICPPDFNTTETESLFEMIHEGVLVGQTVPYPGTEYQIIEK